MVLSDTLLKSVPLGATFTTIGKYLQQNDLVRAAVILDEDGKQKPLTSS